MAHAIARNSHIVILHDDAGSLELVNRNRSSKVGHAFIHDTSVDVELLVCKESASKFFQSCRAVDIHFRRLRSHPCVIEQRTVLEVVIGMMMRDENIAKPVQRDARRNQLSRDTVSTINEERNIIDEDERRRIGAARPGSRWPAFGAEQNDPRIAPRRHRPACCLVLILLLSLYLPKQGIRTDKTAEASQKFSAIGMHS